MSSAVIASAAKQSSAEHIADAGLDCFVAALLAMTANTNAMVR